MMSEPVITDNPREKNLANKDSRIAAYGPWTHLIGSHSPKTIAVKRSENPPLGAPLFHTEHCTSTMDLAWLLHDCNEFPCWASVLSDHQHSGRGQFRRQWISEPGNLYASLRFSDRTSLTSAAPFITALAVNRALQRLGITSEFKWPNDILVHRKKVGGILVEERSGVAIVGIGLNMVGSPSLNDMRDPRAVSPGHLCESGLSMPPLELWTFIAGYVMDISTSYAENKNFVELISSLENIMAFTGDNVVFKPPDGLEFSAVISGLSETGGIRLKTTDGEKTFLSGSFFPVVH